MRKLRLPKDLYNLVRKLYDEDNPQEIIAWYGFLLGDSVYIDVTYLSDVIQIRIDRVQDPINLDDFSELNI
jgi:hypothetical protein